MSVAALTMNQALAIKSQQFGLLTGIFFFGYFLFEIPSNLLLHRVGARIWIARILVSWGIIAALTGFVQNISHVYVLRFALGVAEAGFFPGIILYLTYWFRQREQAQVVAFFMTAIPAASIAGNPVSGAILDHVHWFGISSWRWLFILEAVPAVVFGVLVYCLLPDRPADAKFLSERERDWITAELERETKQKLEQNHLSVLHSLTHRRVWHLAFICFTFNVAMYGISFWMPQVVKSLSSRYSNTIVGSLVAVPYLAALVTMVFVSRHSDRTLERRNHAAIPALVGALGLLSLTASDSAFFSILLLSVAALGIYSFCGPFWSLPGEFLTGFSAAAGIALINSVGNLGGFVGPYAIGAIGQRTGNLRAGLVAVAVSLLIAAILVMLLPAQSQRRSA